MSSPESNGATQELAQEHPDQDTTRMDNIENTMRAIQSQLSALLTQQPATGSTHSIASDQAPKLPIILTRLQLPTTTHCILM